MEELIKELQTMTDEEIYEFLAIAKTRLSSSLTSHTLQCSSVLQSHPQTYQK